MKLRLIRSHMLQADTEQMYAIWIKALQEGIGKAIQGNVGTISRSHLINEESNSNIIAEVKRPKAR